MKKIFLLSALLFSACTISDTYWKPYVGSNNVGSVDSIVINEGTHNNAGGLEFGVEEKFSGSCFYLFGLKMSSNCSPDKIANKYELQTITEVNRHIKWWLIGVEQETTIIGIPKTDN
jgi:hypothetical protein